MNFIEKHIKISDKPEKNKNIINLIKLLVISLLLAVIFGYISYNVYISRFPKSNAKEWLNTKNFTMKGVLVGMVSGVVFGFIDNAGLWFGMDALDPFISGGPNTKAGWGNTFSDLLGSSVGTFVGSIITNMTRTDDTPIWSDALGIIVGCILGIYIPRMITGKD